MSADPLGVEVVEAESPPEIWKALADLHADAFGGCGRAWPASEIAALASSRGAILIRCLSRGELAGFALFRIIAGEAEVVTICRGPGFTGHGVGGALLGAIIDACRANSAGELFLEVSASNIRALGLYRQHGFLSISTRQGYYPNTTGNRVDAIVMRKLITNSIDER